MYNRIDLTKVTPGEHKTTFPLPVAKRQNILIGHVELQTCKHGRYDRQKKFYW
jgi:hypothetical protein